MIVTSISHVYDMYLSMFRTTEYKHVEDESTGKKVVEVEQQFKFDLYNRKGEIESHNI